ncbi:uncharacterized protein [Parasteatoda tepidariorum]|uniref:uncharacterized protein n=1 Tax=Parasteatoda tepidariorum TaxID=114398 RepID=UPI001C725738|nr:uncharacterized protein LOC107438114 [Parasteatoda tepidariorum]
MTYFQKKSFVFTWIIENFSFNTCDVNEVLRSPDFHFGESSWYLCLKPRGECKDKIEFISCFLVLWSPVTCSFPFQFELEITGASGEKLKTLEGNYELFHKVSKWGSSEFLEIEKVKKDAEYGFEDILKVCCYLHTESSGESIITQCIAKTKIDVDRIAFEMNNVTMSSVLDLFKETTLHGGNIFQVAIHTKKSPNKIQVIKVGSNCLKRQAVKCKVGMSCDDEIWTEKASHLFQSKKLPEIWSFCADGIFGAFSRLRKKTVDFFWELSCSYGTNISYISFDRSESSASCSLTTIYPTSRKDMLCMFSNKKYSDVKLRVDSDIIDAHKNILSARSPVFSSMFDKMETHTTILDIVDIDFATLNLLLEFIYTDSVSPINYRGAIDLLIASEKYQVLPLKASCALFLKSKLSIGNVLEVLSAASTACQERLKSDAMDFISANSSSVLGSSEWCLWTKNKDNSKLGMEIMYKLNKNVSFFQTIVSDQVLAKKDGNVRIINSTQGDMHVFNVVLLGEYAPGLTSLASRFVIGQYIGDRRQTCGVEFLNTMVMLEGVFIDLHISDVCSAARFHTMAHSYIIKAEAAIIVYNITDVDSFNSAKTWVKEIQRSKNTNIVIALAGNCADLAEKRKIKREEAEAYADENGLIFMETSAKENINVDAIFLAVASAHLAKLSTAADENNSLDTAVAEHNTLSTPAASPVHGNQNVLSAANATVDVPDTSLRPGNQNIAVLGVASPKYKSETGSCHSPASSPNADLKEENQVENEIGKCLS